MSQDSVTSKIGNNLTNIWHRLLSCISMSLSSLRSRITVCLHVNNLCSIKCSLFAILTPRAKDSVKHFHVTRKDNVYVFGFNKFATLQDFVNHFANQPLLGSDAGMWNVRSSLTSTLHVTLPLCGYTVPTQVCVTNVGKAQIETGRCLKLVTFHHCY